MMRGYEKQPLACKEKHAFATLALDKASRYENCAYEADGLRVQGGVLAYLVGGETIHIGAGMPIPYQFFRFPRESGTSGLGYFSPCFL